MNGMHDVAELAKRYNGLEATSTKLRGAIDKMQKEVRTKRIMLPEILPWYIYSLILSCVPQSASSYDLIKNRTLELERIHETNVILRQLRQFVHAKAQLDHYVQADQMDIAEQGKSHSAFPPPPTAAHILRTNLSIDLRQFSAMAKTLREMETLVSVPQVAAIAQVAVTIPGLRRLGSQLRRSAQERLLIALNEQNQTTVGDCLQVSQ